MRKELGTILLSFSYILLSCGSDDGKIKDALVKEQAQPISSTKPQAYNIVGEWEQTFTVFDKNADNHLNTEERNTPSPNKIGDHYLHFKDDGTCIYSEMEFEGAYEVKMDKDEMTIFIHGPDARRLRILSLNETEMVLMPSGAPGTFLVYHKYVKP